MVTKSRKDDLFLCFVARQWILQSCCIANLAELEHCCNWIISHHESEVLYYLTTFNFAELQMFSILLLHAPSGAFLDRFHSICLHLPQSGDNVTCLACYCCTHAYGPFCMQDEVSHMYHKVA